MFLSPLVAGSVMQPLKFCPPHYPVVESGTGSHLIRITKQREGQICIHKDFRKLGMILSLPFPHPLLCFRNSETSICVVVDLFSHYSAFIEHFINAS